MTQMTNNTVVFNFFLIHKTTKQNHNMKDIIEELKEIINQQVNCARTELNLKVKSVIGIQKSMPNLEHEFKNSNEMIIIYASGFLEVYNSAQIVLMLSVALDILVNQEREKAKMQEQNPNPPQDSTQVPSNVHIVE